MEIPDEMPDKIKNIIKNRTKDLNEKEKEEYLENYKKALIEPGEPIGAVVAQSIGEPGTQMALRTFHEVGVTGFTTLGGFWRLKEILFSTKQPKRGSEMERVMEVYLDEKHRKTKEAAEKVKDRIMPKFLRDVCDISFDVDEKLLVIRTEDKKAKQIIKKIPKFEITEDEEDNTFKIHGKSLVKLKKLWDRLSKRRISGIHAAISPIVGYLIERYIVEPGEEKDEEKDDLFIWDYIGKDNKQFIDYLVRDLGIGWAKNAKIKKSSDEKTITVTNKKNSLELKLNDKDNKVILKRNNVKIHELASRFRIMISGSNLEGVMKVKGVNPKKTTTTQIFETYECLGIEAARELIVRELKKVMDDQGIEVNIRHIMLYADQTTVTGKISQVGRFGIIRDKPSVLARAAFEETGKHILLAAISGETDTLEGVVENIIVGQPVPLGTGTVELAPAHPKGKMN